MSGNWAAFAEAAAAKLAAGGTRHDCCSNTYYVAVKSGFVGHMREWHDEVVRRAEKKSKASARAEHATNQTAGYAGVVRGHEHVDESE